MQSETLITWIIRPQSTPPTHQYQYNEYNEYNH